MLMRRELTTITMECDITAQDAVGLSGVIKPQTLES